MADEAFSSTENGTFYQPSLLIEMPQNVDRKSGRPPKYRTAEQRQRAHVESQTAYRRRRKHETKYFRANFTGDQEWYTPAEYIHAARQVLGTIDLDPASSDGAQATVQAQRFYTAKDNALVRAWSGKVWLNPPFTQPLIEHFVVRLVAEVQAGHVTEAILLTHNYTDTKWFHAAEAAASCICFTRGRIKFVDTKGNRAAPTQGQAFFYFGAHVEQFSAVFGPLGMIR
jgi:phage N-6-adenine-methyltransferase